jgi:hypothetical protein
MKQALQAFFWLSKRSEPDMSGDYNNFPNLTKNQRAQAPKFNEIEFIFLQILVSLLLLDIAHLIPLARSYGFGIHISRCKI